MEAERKDGRTGKTASCGGCLFRGCLGILALCAGAVLTLILFGPSTLGGLARSWGVEWFNSTHEGSLEIEDYHMALFSEQSLSGLRLLDPEGGQVLACDVTFPGWLVFSTRDHNPVWLEFEAEILVDPAGVSNLDRALGTDPSGSLTVSFTETVPLRVEVEGSRLVWKSVRHEDPERGWSASEHVESLLFDRIDGQVSLVFHGEAPSIADLTAVDGNLKWSGGEAEGVGGAWYRSGEAGGYGVRFEDAGGRAGLELELDPGSGLGRVLVEEWANALAGSRGRSGRLRITASSLSVPLDGWPGGISGQLTRPDARVDRGLLRLPVADGAAAEADPETGKER